MIQPINFNVQNLPEARSTALRVGIEGGGEIIVSFDQEGVGVQIMARNGNRLITTYATVQEIRSGALDTTH